MTEMDWAFWFFLVIANNYFAHDIPLMGLGFMILAAMAKAAGTL